MKMETRVFPDLEALSRGALKELLGILQEAIAERKRFAIALAGGHTPAHLYRLWAQAGKDSLKVPWDQVHLFWGDERYVPQDDPLNNYRMARETLISQVPIPAANVHPLPTGLPTPQKVADAYESELREFFGPELPAFDLQLLGLGVEGHTASLFPGSPALEEKRRWVAAIEAPVKPSTRLTLTPVVLNCARNTFFLAAGPDKREILEALRTDPDAKRSPYPAAQIHPAGPVLWFLDAAAAQ